MGSKSSKPTENKRYDQQRQEIAIEMRKKKKAEEDFMANIKLR